MTKCPLKIDLLHPVKLRPKPTEKPVKIESSGSIMAPGGKIVLPALSKTHTKIWGISGYSEKGGEVLVQSSHDGQTWRTYARHKILSNSNILLVCSVSHPYNRAVYVQGKEAGEAYLQY